jgi:hypothetical protein
MCEEDIKLDEDDLETEYLTRSRIIDCCVEEGKNLVIEKAFRYYGIS